MKAINTSLPNNVIYPNFKARKPLTEKDIYNKCHDKWMNIKRADDSSKVIVAEAILYIASLEFLFLQNPDEIIFDCDLLRNKSIHKQKQRGRFLKGSNGRSTINVVFEFLLLQILTNFHISHS